MQSRGGITSLRLFILVTFTASAAFFAGVLFANSSDSPHDNQNFQLFWQSWDILEREYYYDLPNDKKLTYGAVQGLMAAANDPYTFFAPPRDAELDRQSIEGEFGGIGAHVSVNQDGQLVITDPFPDMPAAQAGLLSGDAIIEIDGASVDGLTLDEAVALLRGEVGTKVKLTIYRPSEDRQFSVEITRARVELPTVVSHVYGDIGYIRLYIFNGNATIALEKEINGLLDQNVHGLILDLRGNPGGLLDQAVGISDLFLSSGIVVKQHARHGEDIIYRSNDGDIAEQIPLVILIDGGSASASEVVAGALHDRNRAILIGQTSYGKGSVQHVYDMKDDLQVHVTVALWLTPNETPIQGQGLTPDIEVKTPDTPVEGDDPFIDAALAYFREQGITENQD